MPDHIYTKADLIARFDTILGKTLEEIDNIGMFAQVSEFNLQKGVVGSLIEQCVLGYEPDTKQEADLLIVDGTTEKKTELKSTGMVMSSDPVKHYVAKEPMSITAVGVYDIDQQEFWSSHFWDKLEHMLLVYYHYTATHPVPPYEYRHFPIKGYEFHEFEDDEVLALKQDWEHVRSLAARVVSHHPGPRDKEWKEAVKQEYIDVHGELRRVLSYIDLAPKFPPRFRLKKPIVSTMIAKHFGYSLEQLPGRYTVVTDIDRKCQELTKQYAGKTVGELAKEFNIPIATPRGIDRKGISEQIVVSMFGGTSKKLNQIDLFTRFGLIAKTIVLSATGGRTEDMKLFQIDFEEMAREIITEDDGTVRPMAFEDSDLYSYFADHGFLCIIFEEQDKRIHYDADGNPIYPNNSLSANKFVGFKRLVFTDEFIDSTVRRIWDDTRDKILNNRLIDVVQRRKDGTIVRNANGEVSSAPNFMKSKENAVFIRGSATDSSMKYKTEYVNGIRMIPQNIWIKGTAVIDELNNIQLL